MTKVNALHSDAFITGCRDRRIAAAKKAGKTVNMDTWTETDGLGLYIEVTWAKPEGQGRFMWRHQYKRPTTGKSNRLTYGEFPAITREAARAVAKANRELIEQGIDPAAARDAKREQASRAVALAAENAERIAEKKSVVGSFRWWAEQVEASMVNTWDAKTLADFHRQTQTGRVLVAFGNLDIKDVVANDGALVKQLFDHVFLKEDKQQAALKVKRFVMNVIEEAFAQNAIATIPVLRQRKNAYTVRATEHHPGVTDANDLGRLLRDITMWGHGVTRDALTIALATAQRRENIITMSWEHLEIDNVDATGRGLWTIPRALMKGRRVKKESAAAAKLAQEIPLSTQIVAILRAIREQQRITGKVSPYVFPNRNARGGFMSSTGMSEALSTMDWDGKHTQHGGRTTFRSMVKHLPTCNALPGISIGTLSEGILDHKWGADSVAESSNMPGVYDRLTPQVRAARATVMQAWSDYLEQVGREYLERRAIEQGEDLAQVYEVAPPALSAPVLMLEAA